MNVISGKEAKAAGLKHYFTGKPCKNGHICERTVVDWKCVQCGRDKAVKFRKNNPERKKEIDRMSYEKNKIDRLEKAKIYRRENSTQIKQSKSSHYTRNKESISTKAKAYREENKDQISEQKKAYRKQNKEKVKLARRKYYLANKDKMIESNKQWRRDNPEAYREYFNNRRRTDLDFKCAQQCRGMLQRILRMTDMEKTSDTVSMLGYNAKQLRVHIESQFTEGMSWENHGKWHIDHIVPASLMIRYGVREPELVNALENLQPLWAKDNLKKGNRFVG
jgi:hypothetical protein